MRKVQASLPLAFILAMAAEASAATAADVQPAIPLEAGALRRLLEQAPPTTFCATRMDGRATAGCPATRPRSFPEFSEFSELFIIASTAVWRNC